MSDNRNDQNKQNQDRENQNRPNQDQGKFDRSHDAGKKNVPGSDQDNRTNQEIDKDRQNKDKDQMSR